MQIYILPINGSTQKGKTPINGSIRKGKTPINGSTQKGKTPIKRRKGLLQGQKRQKVVLQILLNEIREPSENPDTFRKNRVQPGFVLQKSKQREEIHNHLGKRKEYEKRTRKLEGTEVIQFNRSL